MKTGGKKGFTLVELSLAVGFISLLSLTVALIINDTVATYRRGLTLNNINTTGMDLVDDMRSVIQSAPPKDVASECESVYSGTDVSNKTNCQKDKGSKILIQQKYANVKVNDDGDGTEAWLPIYGAVCTGSYSYIWNSGYFFGDNAGKIHGSDTTVKPAYLVYDEYVENPSGGSSRNDNQTIGDSPDNYFRLIKIKDNLRAVCKSSLKADTANVYSDYPDPENDAAQQNFINSLDNRFDISSGGITFYDKGIRSSDIEVILKDDVTNPLALYDFTITPPVSNSANTAAFYSTSFILGTLQGGLNVNAKGNFCKTPADYDNDFDYCAINKFNFAAQATGG